jgi:hypothetical protein
MDPEYFIGVSKEHDGFDNFVFEEMWKYFHAKHGHMSQEQLRRHCRFPNVTFLRSTARNKVN